MSNTDRVRAYYNLHRKCFSVQDYKTGLVIEHTNKLCFTNAMFVVRKSGNERVKKEGRKNVHAFVNGIRNDKWNDTNHLKVRERVANFFRVKYDPHTMDFFHYKRINDWLPIDRHWIGNVWLFMEGDRPRVVANIDRLDDTNIYDVDKPSDTRKEPIYVIKDETCIKRLYDGGGFSMEFLRKKQKQINNKKKLFTI